MTLDGVAVSWGVGNGESGPPVTEVYRYVVVYRFWVARLVLLVVCDWW